VAVLLTIVIDGIFASIISLAMFIKLIGSCSYFPAYSSSAFFLPGDFRVVVGLASPISLVSLFISICLFGEIFLVRCCMWTVISHVVHNGEFHSMVMVFPVLYYEWNCSPYVCVGT